MINSSRAYAVIIIPIGIVLICLPHILNSYAISSIQSMVFMLNEGMPFEEVEGVANHLLNGGTLKVIPLWASILCTLAGISMTYLGSYRLLNKQLDLNEMKSKKYWLKFIKVPI